MAYPSSTAGQWPGANPPVGENYINLFKQAYADVIRLQAQDTESRLSDTCMYEEMRGDPLSLDAYKAVSTTTRSRGQQYGVATDAAGLTGDKEYAETPTQRRSISPSFHEFAELFDPRDEPALLRSIRPDGNYLMNVAAAFNRKKDDIIITAFTAETAIQTADLNGTKVAVSYDWGEDIAVAFGGNAAGTDAGDTLPSGTIGRAAQADVSGGLAAHGLYAATIDLDAGSTDIIGVTDLVAARSVLEQNGAINPGDQVFVIMHPSVARNLLADTTLTSYDFNAVRPLMSGEVTNFLGMEFRMTNQLASEVVDCSYDASTNTVSTATGHYTYVYAQSSMVFGMAQDMAVRFDELPERGYSLQVFHSLGLGAMRMDPKKIVRIGSAVA